MPAARRTGDECGSPSPSSSSSQSSSSRREARRRAMSALAMATAMLPAASSRPVGDPRCNVLAFLLVPVRGARGARRDLTRTATTPGARARTLPHWGGRGRVTASQTTEEREGETDVACLIGRGRSRLQPRARISAPDLRKEVGPGRTGRRRRRRQLRGAGRRIRKLRKLVRCTHGSDRADQAP